MRIVVLVVAVVVRLQLVDSISSSINRPIHPFVRASIERLHVLSHSNCSSVRYCPIRGEVGSVI